MDLEQTVILAHSQEFKRFFQRSIYGRATAFALYTKEEDTWFSAANDKILEDLSASKGTMLWKLEGMDTFINNTKQLEIPGVFKEDHSFNSGTIGSMGAESKQADNWTQWGERLRRKGASMAQGCQKIFRQLAFPCRKYRYAVK